LGMESIAKPSFSSSSRSCRCVFPLATSTTKVVQEHDRCVMFRLGRPGRRGSMKTRPPRSSSCQSRSPGRRTCRDLSPHPASAGAVVVRTEGSSIRRDRPVRCISVHAVQRNAATRLGEVVDFGPPHCRQHPQRSPCTAERPHLAHRNALAVIRCSARSRPVGADQTPRSAAFHGPRTPRDGDRDAVYGRDFGSALDGSASMPSLPRCTRQGKRQRGARDRDPPLRVPRPPYRAG